MSDLIQLEMTLDEARETDRLIKRHINTTRYLLLDMRDRKGWKALGYESFVEYGKQSLGYEKGYLYQLADAGEISIQLGYSQESAIADSPPPESQLRPLKQVPEEVRKEIWEEATRKAQEEGVKLTAKRVEEETAAWKQRAEEFRTESNQRRQTIRELEQKTGQLQTELEITKSILDEKPSVVIQAPDDYKKTKEHVVKLKEELAALRKKQTELVQQQVAAKLRERDKELADLERQTKEAEALLKSLNQQIDSYTSIEQMTRFQRGLIEKTRSQLVDLASHLETLEPLLNDPETSRLWDALADMLRNGATAIECFRGKHSPNTVLKVVHSGAA